MNPKTLVVGLGNLVHRDDGVGVHAIVALRGDRRIPSEVGLLDGGTQGLGLLHHLSGIRRLLVIDAIDAGEPAGTLLHFEGKALRGLPGKASVHQLGFSDLMIALQLLDDSPEEVIVLGIQPGSTEWGVELSPPVASALPALVGLVLRYIDRWEKTRQCESQSPSDHLVSGSKTRC
jgi:hydrogenase maturation protease